MKKLLKLFLAILTASTGIIQAEENLFYWALHGWINLNRHGAAVATPVIIAGKTFYDKNKFSNLPDAPAAVTAFCREKFEKHSLNPDHVLIKVNSESGFIEAFGNSLLIFNPLVAQEFNRALENPDNEQSPLIIKIYATFVDHEIAHIKGNDGMKRQAVVIAAHLMSYAASSYLINSPRFSSWFAKPTNILELFTMLCAYNIIVLANNIFIFSAHSMYSQYQETNADAYAMAHSTDVTALRLTANFLESLDNSLIEFVCGAQANPSIPFLKIKAMEALREMLIEQYAFEKPEEEFRSWVKKQTTMLAILKFVYDAEHPSGFSRAQKMRLAADALEAQTLTEGHMPLAA